jgi:hypothetical protein
MVAQRKIFCTECPARGECLFGNLVDPSVVQLISQNTRVLMYQNKETIVYQGSSISVSNSV